MSLAQMIRRVAGGKPRRMSDDPPKDGEDEDLDPAAEAEQDDQTAEDVNPDKDAEDDDTTADDSDEADVEDEDSQEGMSDKEKAAFAKGRRAERKRIGAILGSPRADGNPALAAHLAFKTADSPAKALAALKYGGASQSASSGRLSERMQARGHSKTGRGGDGDVRSADSAKSWDGALAKAGVKMKGK
ncbi:hypothetical protein [Sinorhizobium meliloti]|uniref:hypothetical protein n=1 Tax=Rhizobium meliloti TaxID=382 RepID=UPI000FD79965|nr:hypothetical protein [Sinorhizobium meliloti]MCM5689142.1 hypothetical protein [Sinorhizobium meliloti]MCO6425444.1 hypothetical protein [Sinorhizobium meliloti]RVM17659.1 hypothetical protein CN134_08510 [Sinorhizobium meliloti]RVO20513.1 hypothetical protein CN098_34880 [Sinorhizobium meliloti]